MCNILSEVKTSIPLHPITLVKCKHDAGNVFATYIFMKPIGTTRLVSKFVATYDKLFKVSFHSRSFDLSTTLTCLL